MTPEEIIEMAKQAGLLEMDYEIGQWEIHEFTTFAKLVAAKEREACAKVSEAKGLSWKSRHDINPDNAEKAYMASQFIASAIRARGEA